MAGPYRQELDSISSKGDNAVEDQHRDMGIGKPPLRRESSGRLENGPTDPVGVPVSKVKFLLLPAVAFLLVVYLVPLTKLLGISFAYPNWSLASYVRVFDDQFLWVVFLSTLRLAAGVTAICFPLGYLVAYLMLTSSDRARTIITIVVILPLWTSLLVRAYAWIVLLGRDGVLNFVLTASGLTGAPLPMLYDRAAVYVGMVHVMLPFMILPIYSAMRQIDLKLIHAARSLGASRIATFLWVFFPLTVPGVAAGSLLVFIQSLAFYVTPALLGGEKDVTYVMLIDREVNRFINWPLASAMSVLLVLVTVLIALIYQRLLGFSLAGAVTRSSSGSGAGLVRAVTPVLAVATRLWLSATRAWWRYPSRERPDLAPSGERRNLDRGSAARRMARLLPSWRIAGWGVIAFILAPIIIVFPLAFNSSAFMEFPPSGMSLRWFETFFASPAWIDPTLRSFEIATITMVIAVGLGTLGALGLVRGQFRGKEIVMWFLISPIIVPVIILAIALYFAFAPLHLNGTRTGLILAHSVLAIPFVIVLISGSLQTVGESLERAARSLGASPFRAFLFVTFPLIRPAVITAALFAFLASFDEVVIALFLTGPGSKTLPRQLWESVKFDVQPTIAAVAALLIFLSTLLLVFSEILRVRAVTRREQSQDSRPQ